MIERDDAALAARLAEGAGAVLMALRERADPAVQDLKELGRAGDASAQAYLLEQLRHARPDDAILSEEAADSAARLGADRVWIIDPLDGTREFAEYGAAGGWRNDWAVHVALWARGAADLIAGAVALPARGEVHRADLATWRDRGAADVVAGRRPLRIAVSRSRPPEIVDRLAARHDVELVPMGSAGVKVMSVVTGETDAYLHAGGQYEWDSAAPVVVARGAGLVAARLDGSALQYNRQDPWLPDLLVTSAVVHPMLAGMVAGLLGGRGGMRPE